MVGISYRLPMQTYPKQFHTVLQFTPGVITPSTYLLFDLDGTIVDTNEANELAYLHAIASVVHMDRAKRVTGAKRITRETLHKLVPNLTPKEYRKIVNLKTKIYPLYLRFTQPNRSVIGIIERYAKTNPIVLATKSYAARADLLLRYYGLLNHFDRRYYKETYGGKDDKYRYILNDLGISPRHVVLFENDWDEIRSALHLGMPTHHIHYQTKGETDV